jgi:hypothetical protein
MEGGRRWEDEVEDMARLPREGCGRVMRGVDCADVVILIAGVDMVLIGGVAALARNEVVVVIEDVVVNTINPRLWLEAEFQTVYSNTISRPDVIEHGNFSSKLK